jgi:hypothetical protein
MRQTLSVISSVAMAFFLTGCQNETLNSTPDDTLVSQKSSLTNRSGNNSLFATSMEIVSNLDEKTINPDTEITQSLLDGIVMGYDLEGTEYLTPEFANRIIEKISYAKEFGLDTFSKNLGHSVYFSDQLRLAGDGKDISAIINSTDFANLSSDEQGTLRTVISYQQDYFNYLAQNGTSAKYGDGHIDNTAIGYGFYGGLIGLALGASFGPLGATIGFVAGAIVGVVISIFK